MKSFFIGFFTGVIIVAVYFMSNDKLPQGIYLNLINSDEGNGAEVFFEIPNEFGFFSNYITVSVISLNDQFSIHILTPDLKSFNYSLRQDVNSQGKFFSFFNENLDGKYDLSVNGIWDLFYDNKYSQFFIPSNGDRIGLMDVSDLSSHPIHATSISGERFLFEHGSWRALGNGAQ